MCLVGSINGLVCMSFFSDIDHHFILWNPVIRVSKKIVLPKRSLLNIKHFRDLLYGFGWDSVADDFKLSVKCANSSQAFVYSCQTNGWSNKVVSNPFSLRCKPKYGSPSVIVKGNPYWEFLKISAILKFEATNNEFIYLKVPCVHRDYSLLNFNDCLARIEFGSHGVTDMYIFNEECGLWSKMYTFSEILRHDMVRNSLRFKHGGEIANNVYGPMSNVIGSMGMKPVKIRDCKRSRTFDTPMSFHWFMPFGPISSNCRATIGHVVNDENTGKVYAKGWKCRCASTVNRNSPPGKKCGLITKRRTGRLGGQTTATASEADNGKKKKVVSVLDLISRPYWPYTI